MKPLFITGTQRDVGKTTLSIGLLHYFRQRGLRVAYAKPLGQRTRQTGEGRAMHDDAMVVSRLLDEASQAEMAMPLSQGRVEKEIYDLKTPALAEKIDRLCKKLRDEHDLVIIEGMGNVAMGSCLGMSGADLARLVGGKALLVSGGGIGRTIDEIALSCSFIRASGAEFLGVVINKVWPEKFDRVKNATTQGLEKNLDIKSYGVIPYEQQLSCPTMEQVFQLSKGELIGGREHLSNVVENTIVAAMESSHMIRYLKQSTLVITPGDRTDNILASLSAHTLGDIAKPTMAGLVLTGGFRPDGACMKLITDSHLPVILVKEDTYTAATLFRQTIFKIPPDDDQKINTAICLVRQYVDVEGILEAL